MQDSVFLDTNILVYLANEDSPYHSKVLGRFKELLDDSELWVSRQVLREYAVVMTRADIIERPLSPREAALDMGKWESLFHVADETEEVTEILKGLVERYKLRGKIIHDANIVATMMANSIAKLFTLNVGDFKRFSELEILYL